MKIAFCDDEQYMLDVLQQSVSAYFTERGLEQPDYASYLSGEELLAAENMADIVFLDVEMTGISGIEVGAQLMHRNPRTKIIIVTSYPDYLDDAMRFHVFRYLSKPINLTRLYANLKDAIYQYSISTVKVPVETEAGTAVYSADEIICIESSGRKAMVHTIYGSCLSPKGMEYWTGILEQPCFYQTYRSYIINMNYVVFFNKSIVQLKHEDIEINAYLSRRRCSDFKNKYLIFMESTR